MLDIRNFKKQSRFEDFICLCFVVAIFVIIAWLCSPPGNKFLQLAFLGHNIKYHVSSVFNKSTRDKSVYYRNNAIYHAKMYPDKDYALDDINHAIEILPKNAPEAILKDLYHDRAEINLFLGHKKDALSDFVKAGKVDIKDFFKIAMLFKELGKYKYSLMYCNNIVNTDIKAYSGYLCLSEVYVSVNRLDIAKNIWNLAILRNPSSAKSYLNRAEINKKMGNMNDSQKDYAMAQKIYPNIDLHEDYVETIMQPKQLLLPIK